jgi:hypothetical protein
VLVLMRVHGAQGALDLLAAVPRQGEEVRASLLGGVVLVLLAAVEARLGVAGQLAVREPLARRFARCLRLRLTRRRSGHREGCHGDQDPDRWDLHISLDLGLADVLDGSAAPAEGELVAGARRDNLVRRCLRGVAWLELMVAPKLLVHFGYDMRLVVAVSIPLAAPLDQVRSSGLFVYDSDTPLPTLDAWSNG